MVLTDKYHKEIAALLHYQYKRRRINEKQLRHLVIDFGDYLYRDNPYFNFKEFHEACGVYNVAGRLITRRRKRWLWEAIEKIVEKNE